MNPDPMDYPSLLRRCMGRRELAARLVLKFVAQADADAQEIARALQRADAAALAASAHRLKGAAANISAESLRQIAAELEILGRSGNPASAGFGLERLREELERLKSSWPRIETSQPGRGH